MHKLRATEIRERSALSKQLRLDVAQLTDVGRKRPHNEDNMAYVIPKDPQVMARKGALFIVADGMGGHAAGEVASEIAVDTVSKVYYQDDSDDAAVSLLHAIKRANALIHQRAAENMMRSGMGTTCVAAVFRGGTAYIANVGDSRSYLVRRGVIKQVSQDHSWVEEQVRAGLLTREQARSHAQRNVITRCLGTQPDVEIDVFSERLEEGDSMFLCSDGLSGLVSDEELGQIVDQYLPQESVYHLVERANENGGSDNITAVVVRVQEVGWEPPSSSMPRPVGVGGREADEDTAVIGQFRGGAPLGALPARPGDTRLLSGPLRMASGPLPSSPEIDTAPQAAVPRLSSRRNRLLYPTLAIFVILVISLGGAAYYWIRGSQAQNIDASLTQMSTLINQAKDETNTNPGEALQKLNQAQGGLAKVQEQGNSLSDIQRTQASTLQSSLTTATKQAILSYDQQSHILPLPCTTTTQVSTLNEGNTNTHASSLAAVRNGNKDAFYVLGEDHNLYQLNDQMTLANKITLPGNAQPLMITGNDTRLLVLASLPAQGKDPAGYALYIFPAGKGQASGNMSIDAALTKDGGTPSLITTSGPEVYVVLTPQEASTSAVILNYTLDGDKFKDLTPRKAKISVSAALVSIAALKNTQLFFLLANGNVQSQQFAEGNLTPVSVVLQPQPPLVPALAANPQTFQTTTPVPVPAAQTASSLSVLSIPRATQLTAALVDNVAHLYIMDDQYDRVLDLKMDDAANQPATPTSTPTKGGTAPSMKMSLVQQYVSPVLLAKVKSLVIDPAAPQLYLLTQGTDNNGAFQLAQIDTRPSDANTCAGA
jgi:serine/threonine protein phosphatase PrpC